LEERDRKRGPLTIRKGEKEKKKIKEGSEKRGNIQGFAVAV